MSLSEKIQKLIHGVGQDEKRVMNYILIIALLGVFLVVWSNIQSPITRKPVDIPLEQEEQREEDLAFELAESLSRIVGVGEVKVQVYYSSGPFYRFGQDRRLTEKAALEEDSQGGTKQTREENQDYQVVVLRDGSGGEQALVKEEKKPLISGVLVVAEGAEELVIRDTLIRSVSTLLQLPLYRIEVVSGKGGR